MGITAGGLLLDTTQLQNASGLLKTRVFECFDQARSKVSSVGLLFAWSLSQGAVLRSILQMPIRL